MIKISVSLDGIALAPHWYDPDSKKTKADRFGKRGGYRVHPSGEGHNKSENAVFYRCLVDVAEHLIANPDWGLRFTTPDGAANIFYDDITIEGKLRRTS